MKQRRHRVYNIEELCALKDDGNRWLVRDMIPRIGRTMVWGEGGTYKTSILIDLAVAVASGGALLRQFAVDEHGPVFIVSAEGSIYNNRDRILSHLRAREGASPEQMRRSQEGRSTVVLPTKEQLPIHYCQKAYLLDDPSDREEFREDVKEIGPKLIILDPLDSCIEGDENSAKETKGFRRFLDEIIEEQECSVMIIHHSTKSQETPSIRGSSAWRGWIDTSLFFRKKELDVGGQMLQYVEVESKKQRDGNEGKLFTALPEFDAVRGMTTYMLVDAAPDPDILTRSTVQQKVLTALERQGAMTQQDLTRLLGFTWKRIQTALRALADDGYVDNNARVSRATSADGSRQRGVNAWRHLGKTSLVDVAAALIRARQAAEERELDQYEIQFGPPPPQHGSNGDGANARIDPRILQAPEAN